MKLIACHIENFGKLSDFSMEFAEGINVINESNAWGKSTLAAFLKVMFYGLDAKKDPKVFEKERNLYRPWQGGAFGGELDFELDGKSYRISRTFGRTEKNDEFHLYDLSTNLECDDYSENIGAEIFDLDSASFKRSIYIAQNDCGSETSDRINAKLGNLAENTDDINNFENASRRMKEMLNQLTPDRVTGSIKKRKNYITQLSQELRSLESAKDGLDAIRHKEQLVSSQIKELLDIRKNYGQALVVASEDSRRKELYTQYDAICQEVEEKEAKKTSYKEIFPEGIPATDEFKAQMKNIRSMEEIRASIKSGELTLAEHESWSKLRGMFDRETPEESNIDVSLDTLVAVEKQKEEIARQEAKLAFLEEELSLEIHKPKFTKAIYYKVLLILGAIIALVACGALVAWYLKVSPIAQIPYFLIIDVSVVAVGLILLLIGIISGIRVRQKKKAWETSQAHERSAIQEQYDVLSERVDAMKADIRSVHSTIGTFLGRFHVFGGVNEYQSKLYELKGQLHEYQRLSEKIENCSLEKTSYMKLQEKVLNFANMYQVSLGDDLASGLNILQNKATEYQLAMDAYREVCKKKEVFEKNQDKSFWTKEALCPYSIDELNSMIQQADEKLEELKGARIQYGKQLEELQEQLDLFDEKKTELEEQQLLQEQDTEKYQLIKVTHDFLQRAKEQFTARYMEPIAKGFSKYYQMLTGDTKGNWMIDANISLKVREQGELRDTKWLSAGYQDLIGVCMRLALVDAMYEEEKPFLILDDPFVNLDYEKVACGNNLLLAVAEEYQVIYFTCHDSRSPL